LYQVAYFPLLFSCVSIRRVMRPKWP